MAGAGWYILGIIVLLGLGWLTFVIIRSRQNKKTQMALTNGLEEQGFNFLKANDERRKNERKETERDAGDRRDAILKQLLGGDSKAETRKRIPERTEFSNPISADVQQRDELPPSNVSSNNSNESKPDTNRRKVVRLG